MSIGILGNASVIMVSRKGNPNVTGPLEAAEIEVFGLC